jgi:hypothetical protein
MAATSTTQDSVEPGQDALKLSAAAGASLARGDENGDREPSGLANGSGYWGTNLTHAELEGLGFSPRRKSPIEFPTRWMADNVVCHSRQKHACNATLLKDLPSPASAIAISNVLHLVPTIKL